MLFLEPQKPTFELSVNIQSSGRKIQVEGEEGGSIVWPVEGWGLRLYADVLLPTDICSPPVVIVTTGKGT
ncbi:hypothetical protein NQZ68_003075 [Dissostichus eleginoides]|nr:hypothetical protein NQZ68_003075 [Dissostichus eleginoides]